MPVSVSKAAGNTVVVFENIDVSVARPPIRTLIFQPINLIFIDILKPFIIKQI